MIHDIGCGWNVADGERIFGEAIQRGGESLEMGDFARHKELERILGAGVVAEIDEAFVNDFGAGFSGDVAAEINIQFAGDFEVIGSPGIAHGIVERDAPAASDGDEGIGFGGAAGGFHWFEMHTSEGADDFEMAEFFSSDVHEHVLAGGVFAIESLDGVLHGRSKFAVGAAELLEQHVAEAGLRVVDVNRIH